MVIGLIKEGKIPADSRVALTPKQCRFFMDKNPDVRIVVQPSATRCFTDTEYERAGVKMREDLEDCDILFGIKEIPVAQLLASKTYFFFSHTKKLQPYNRAMLQDIIKKNIKLIDYECLVHEDGARIIGFGFFAGVVGAHNGMMAYGERTGTFKLERVHKVKSFNDLIHTYFGLHLPAIKIAVTGSGRVAHGVLEIMNLMGIFEVEPEDYAKKTFAYPVYVHLKGGNLYLTKDGTAYERDRFHEHPEDFTCLFSKYIKQTDILINGVYWDSDVPRLFERESISKKDFRIKTIADITDDYNGSVPCNLGDSTIEHPVYGVDKITNERTAPYLAGSVDIMAVGNLPNELPRDASRYFGEQLLKFVLPELLHGRKSRLLDEATIAEAGKITSQFSYMKSYATEE